MKSTGADGAALGQNTPGRLVLVTFQLGVDDGAGGAADGQLLPGPHPVTEVSEPPPGILLKLLLRRRTGGVDRGP